MESLGTGPWTMGRCSSWPRRDANRGHVEPRVNRIMWAYIGVAYLVLGLAAAGFTLAVFPPQTGYRPPWQWVLLAVLSYFLLWPFLAAIGLGYLIGQWYQRPRVVRTAVIRRQHRHLYRTLYEETPN